MPSPFPGMDPFLEAPRLWRDVHKTLIVVVRSIVNASLPENYAVRIEESLYLAMPRKEVRPDVAVVEVPARGGLAVATRPVDAPLIVDSPEPESIPYLEIIARGDTDELVTAIEILSPTNKARGNNRERYRRKHRRFLAAGVHLLEIDLLRDGAHTVAAPESVLRREVGRWNYLVSLHRAGDVGRFSTWPRTLRDRLPVVAVPLRPPVPDIALDLQAALDRAYDESGWDLSVDYNSTPPAPPLTPDDIKWCETLLREKGVRA